MAGKVTQQQIRWCAQECERQQSGEMSVYDLFIALESAQELYQSHSTRIITMDHVREIGYRVEPKKNRPYRYFRETPVLINGHPAGVSPDNIEHAVYQLLGSQTDLTADEFYQEFEDIHPFIDGNGRVGAIFWNWRASILHHPSSPPEYMARGTQETVPASI